MKKTELQQPILQRLKQFITKRELPLLDKDSNFGKKYFSQNY